MRVALWAEIRRLSEIDKLSGRVIARRLHCSRHTVTAALEMQQPPSSQAARRASLLDPYLEQINNLLAKYPELSAVRIREEIARGPQGYTGSAIVVRRYLRKVHPEFLALCGYFCLQPVPCARRDPESKGVVEGGVGYVKHNALAGRTHELRRFEDYLALAPYWRDQVANLRIHETTHERPSERFHQERALLRPLPAIPFDTDEVVPAVVNPHARVNFDGNRYSAPPQFVRRPLTLRISLRFLSFGLPKRRCKFRFLNVLDDVPADVEVTSRVLDGRSLRQLQGITFEGMGVGSARVGDGAKTEGALKRARNGLAGAHDDFFDREGYQEIVELLQALGVEE